MPMIRYEIRNEYSLADPELYRASDKDDPEALLEGVAMAGLVGVLRQLGDLAEFAADIFHNLHEEVMATAARGHSLMVRVQQLETEVPSIERAFLSQTDHSSFFYNEGIDRRSNLRIDENLVTQGNLPRFVMDSYEECRPPPRLFLLDKFDVAGAGACLKRYTDPSFFKVETSRMSISDIQREKKILKPKKKGSHLRNGETPKTIPTSSTKLHQLLSVEGAELGVSSASRRVKLKRKLNGFPFDSKTGKRYMEKLMSSSPEHKLLHEVNEIALPSLILVNNCQNESGLEVLEVGSMNTDRESVGRKRSPPSPDREEIVLNPSTYDPTKVCADDSMSAVPNSGYGFARNGVSSSTLDKVPSEKVIAVDAESHREGRLTGYESDGISSDAEIFVDAPLTMESDTDIEPKFFKGQQVISDGNKEHISYRSSDSRSTGDSQSDERKEMSSFSCFDSPSTSTENLRLGKSAEGFPSVDNPEIGIGSASFQQSDSKVFPVDLYSQPVVCYSTHARTNSTDSRPSDSEQPASSMCRNESISSSLYSDPGVVTKYMLKQPGSDETASTSDEIEKEANMVTDIPHHPHLSAFEVHHEDESDHKDGNLLKNRTLRSNKFTARSRRTTGTQQLGSSKNPISGKSDDKFPKLHEETTSSYAGIQHCREDITPMVSQKENVIDKPGNEDSNISVDVSDNDSGEMEESLLKKLNETSSPHAQTADAEENCSDNYAENQNSSKNLISSHLAKSTDCLWPGLDVNQEDIIPEQQTAVHENLAVRPPTSCEAVALCGKEIKDDVSPLNTEALESSYHMLGRSEEPAGESDPSVVNGILLPTSSEGEEVTEFCDSKDETSLNEAHVECDEFDSEGEKSGSVDVASTELAVPRNAVAGDTYLNESLEELVEERTHCCEDAGLDELEKSHNCLTGIHGEDGSVDKVVKTFGLPGNQLDQQLPDSGELSPNSDHEDHNGARDSLFTSSLVDHPNSLSASKPIIIPCNRDITVSGDPKNSLGSKFTFCHPMSEVNLVNLADLPPLPPLPPMQWRMGKLERASSCTEVELKKLELLPQNVSPLTASTDGVNSTLLVTCADDSKSSLLNVCSNGISSSPEEAQQSSVETVTKVASEKEVDEHSCANLASKDDLETVDLLSKIKSKQLLVMPTPESESTPPAEEDGVEHGSATEELPYPCLPLLKDVAALEKSEQREVTEQVKPQLQTVDERDSLSEQMRPNDMHQTIDLPTKIGSKQQQFVMPTLESESMSPAEDGVAHDSHTEKLPPSGATLVEDAGLDKSRPKNVPEEGLPRVQEVDERDCLSGQMSTQVWNKTIDHPPLINSTQQQIDMPTPESEPTLPAQKDGIAYGNHAEKLPGACSPPIEDAAAFDKNQPRDVAELNKSQLQNGNENQLSEQIRTNSTHEIADLPQKMEGKQQRELTSQSEENETAHGNRTGKQLLPHNPLVEDKSVLDKSKLRKVSERVIPEVPKLDDKNSFLEQIRTKSFNLKRATTTSSALRPSILSRAPTTNVKVAAILEKANAIRQAMAGSDEDDDGSWSDS